MTTPESNAKDVVQGRSESDMQDFYDERVLDSPFSETGIKPHEIAEEEGLARASEDLLAGLRQLQGGEDIRWQIFRVGEMDDTRNGFLIECATTNLTQSWIRDNFGGGQYRIRGHYPNGKYAAQRTVRVAGDAPRKVANVTSVSDKSNGFDLGAFLAQQDARDRAKDRADEERRKQERKESEDRDEKRRKDRNDMLALVLPVVASSGGALTSALAGRQDNTATLIAAVKGPDPLTMLAQLKALQGNGDNNTIQRILPMLIDMAGQRASGGDTGWLDVVRELAKSAGPTIGTLIESSVQKAAAAQAQNPGMSVSTTTSNPTSTTLPALSGPNPASGTIVVPEPVRRRSRPIHSVTEPAIADPPASPSTRTAESERAHTAGANGFGGNDMSLLNLLPHLPWLKQQLATMGRAAAAGRDPQVYAALFLEELPKGIDIQLVGQMLGRTDWFEQLCKLDAGLAHPQIQEWLDRMRQMILQSIEQELGASIGSHSAQQASSDARATARVDVRGPGHADVRSAQVPAPKPEVKDPGRPTKVPSLSGEDS